MSNRVLIVIIFFVTPSIFAQTFSGGIIFDTGAELTKKSQKTYLSYMENGKYVGSSSFEQKQLVLVKYEIFYSMKWKIADNYKIEFRPGVTYDELFFSPQVGIYLRYYFGQNYYCAAGLLAEMHGGGGNGFTVTQFPTSASLAFGKEMLKDFWLVLSANKALDEYIGTEHPSSPGYFHNIDIEHYLFWTFKLGAEFTF